eukprot:gene10674-7418_t
MIVQTHSSPFFKANSSENQLAGYSRFRFFGEERNYVISVSVCLFLFLNYLSFFSFVIMYLVFGII